MNTDCFIGHIQNKNVIMDFAYNIEKRFGTSNYKVKTPFQQISVSLEDVLKTSSRHFLKTSSTRLQSVTSFGLRSLLKTSCKDVMKTSHKTSSKRLGRRKTVTLKTSSRRLEDMS